MNLQQRNRLLELENKLMVTKEDTGGGRYIDQEYGINIYTLLYIKQINKDLLCSTGNYIQYLAITNKGKEYEEKYITALLCLHLKSI